jgi:hypothetical protein
MGRKSHIRTRSATRYASYYAFSASVLALYKCDYNDDNHTLCAIAELSSAKKRRDDGHQLDPPCHMISS